MQTLSCIFQLPLQFHLRKKVAGAPSSYYAFPRTLVLRHDLNRGGLFPIRSPSDSWNLNEGDPGNPKCSHGLRIFRTLPDLMAVSVSCTDTKMWEGNDEKKKFIGGLVLFRLCYPEVEGDACLVFDQQIDPRYMHHMLVGLARQPIKLLSKNK